MEERIEMLETYFNITPTPTDEELLEFAKLAHPYYQLKNELESLKSNTI